MFCDRSTEAMQYVISLAEGDIAPSRVIAVLYYAQVCSVVLRGDTLFEEQAEFSVKGSSVYPRLYRQMRVYGVKELQPELATLTEAEQEYLKTVWQVLNGYSPNAIKAVLLRDKKRIRRHLKEKADRMTTEETKGQYETLFRKYGVESPVQLKQFFSASLKE